MVELQKETFNKSSEKVALEVGFRSGMYQPSDVGRFSYSGLINTDYTVDKGDDVSLNSVSQRQLSVESPHLELIDDLFIDNNECLDIDQLLEVAESCIARGYQPVRIPKGSSGSYFIKDSTNANIAVFKPKNEEPYGHLNPKWQKWIQRMCLPCFFGRGCILANHGYLSEVGASVVDSFFNFGITPTTTVAWLSSEAFYYRKLDHTNTVARKLLHENLPNFIRKKIRLGLPLKVGSFQRFVGGYKDACDILPLFPKGFCDTLLGRKFLAQFERLVALDYIIRNTDRGNDNWLIKLEEPLLSPADNDFVLGHVGDVKIAAIDNGLAFPFKHPDSWRSYPFNWAYLPYSQNTFSDEFKKHVLSIITQPKKIIGLEGKLRTLFKIDKKFNKGSFENQMKVVRGQVYNLKVAMEQDRTFAELVQMRPLYLNSFDFSDLDSDNLQYEDKKPFFGCI